MALRDALDRAIADCLSAGAENIHFLGTGGAAILMQPAAQLLQRRSRFPAFIDMPAALTVHGITTHRLLADDRGFSIPIDAAQRARIVSGNGLRLRSSTLREPFQCALLSPGAPLAALSHRFAPKVRRAGSVLPQGKAPEEGNATSSCGAF